MFIPNFQNILASQAENVSQCQNLLFRTIRYLIVSRENISLSQVFTYDNISYTALQMINNLTITLSPYSAINGNGELTGVSLEYDLTSLSFSN
ncbi:hypothetical protein IKS57_04895 [bacterium]|nr:hypothetical protein [bacterium]